jgi:hypothetical protein
MSKNLNLWNIEEQAKMVCTRYYMRTDMMNKSVGNSVAAEVLKEVVKENMSNKNKA